MKKAPVPSKVFFSEKQRFTQWWFWLLMAAVNGIFLYGTYIQLLEGRVFGDRPLPDGWLLAVTGMVLLLTASFALTRLETYYAEDGIYARFYPLERAFHFFPWENITRAAIRKYKPLIEYGGWGYRSFGLKRAFNIAGNMGLQLEFRDGRKLLIGTNRPDALADALKNETRPSHKFDFPQIHAEKAADSRRFKG